ncbi:MAG: carbohydrate binding family 9 domain-containing protein, partial [Gemmatimonadaceae bacterium]
MAVAQAADGIRVDGLLTEPVWSTVDSIGALTQVEPREGAAASMRTVARVIITADAIVIGVRADDPEPSRIVSFARQRDADLDSEDHIKIVLDTYLDGRSGYVFAVNPNGARYDALVANQGEDENSSWDAIWEAATARTPAGWSAEILIPLKSLLFRRGLSQWGFNIQRRIQRLQETDRWASADRDITVTQTSRAGLLTQLPTLSLGLGVSVRPAVTVGGAYDSVGASLRSRSQLSLDATQRLGANTLGSLTVNTDFAETEVDSRRVNLSRFPLFFPEKRTFFL